MTSLQDPTWPVTDVVSMQENVFGVLVGGRKPALKLSFSPFVVIAFHHSIDAVQIVPVFSMAYPYLRVSGDQKGGNFGNLKVSVGQPVDGALRVCQSSRMLPSAQFPRSRRKGRNIDVTQ